MVADREGGETEGVTGGEVFELVLFLGWCLCRLNEKARVLG